MRIKPESAVEQTELPRELIDYLMRAAQRFLQIEAAGGLVLLLAALIALVLANSPLSEPFRSFWEIPLGVQIGTFAVQHSLKHWINDGLMVLFFFVVGLEVKRELVHGELRALRRAALPIAAALGGMLAPAALYLLLLHGQPGQHGWGIAMATDIAFVVGCLALLGRRVPHSLRVMLLSLAIVDDIGAILVIAVGYTQGLYWPWLLGSLLGIGLVLAARWLGIRSLWMYTVLGLGVWFACHESGIHATLAGVVLGLLTPAQQYVPQGTVRQLLDRTRQIFHGDSAEASSGQRIKEMRSLRWVARETIPPLDFLETVLHPWTSFVILPLFALANADVVLDLTDLTAPVALAIMAGLVLGKPLGIGAASGLLIWSGLGQLPRHTSSLILFSSSCLAGIGFTMSLFIAELALDGELLRSAKLGILTASVLSAALGLGLLFVLLPREDPPASAEATPAAAEPQANSPGSASH